MKQKLTIAVCTYNRKKILEECLQSLQEQTVPLTAFSVLIIDNNSTDNTREFVDSLQKTWLGLRYVFEKNQGLSHARNHALAETATEWLAFLDDDAKAHADWVATILETIGKEDFGAFGGPYYAWHRFGPAPKWLPEEFAVYTGQTYYGELTPGEAYIPGGNCAFNTLAARQAGGFPVDMGMTGGKCAYGEEDFFFRKLASNGVRLGFVPEMKIDHCVLPYKYKLSWQLYAQYAHGKAWMRLESDFSLKRLIKLFVKLGVFLVLAPCLFFQTWCTTKYWQKGLIRVGASVNWLSGACLAGIVRLFNKKI